jgi:nucleoside phosphorylase
MGVTNYMENHIYKRKSGTVIPRYQKAGHHIKGSVSVGTVKVTMVSRVLRAQCNVDCSVMLGVCRAVSRHRD